MKTIKSKMKYSRAAAVVLSFVIVMAIALTGTLAWLSVSQSARNEKVLDINPGGRLHDDFNGSNKDVYAENYTTKEDEGEPLYVRIRLSEYMEVGKDAGLDRDNPDREADSLIDGADINDKKSWAIHKPTEDSTEICTTDPSFHDYWTWELGGSTIYMPTFDKNKDSLEADINGTWDSVDASGNHYSDYESYTLGKPETGDAQYAKDAAVGTEVTDANGNVLYRLVANETHSAKQTQTAEVMTMQTWLDNGAVPGKFWVWDSDGWAYWAEALQPEEATGCLITGIKQKSYVTGEMYYAIDVLGEFATAFEWGIAGDGENGTGEAATGFYKNGLTEEGKYLLDRIASIVETDNGIRYLSCGNNIYKQIYDNGTLGVPICAGEDLKIATADDQTDVIELKENLVLDGKDYGKFFLGPRTNNTYWAMGMDKLLGTEDDIKIWYLGSGDFPGDPIVPEDISFRGADHLDVTGLTEGMAVEAGQSISGITTSVTLNGTAIPNQKVIWTITGKTSVNTEMDTSTNTNTLKIGADEAIGNELTITVKSDEDKAVTQVIKVKVVGPDTVSVKKGGQEVDTMLEIEPSQTMNLTADVMREGHTYANNKVSWTIAGQRENGTDVTGGTLSVDSAEMGNKTLTITATSVNDPAVKKDVQVKVLSPASVSITSDGTEVTPQQDVEVNVGESKTFVATVKRSDGTTYANNKVKWTITGATKTGTKIENGVLTVDSDEPEDTELTIKATAVNDTSVYKTVKVKVVVPSLFDDVPPGSTDTVNIDGVEFYVLAKDGDKTLIWAKGSVGICQFGSSNTWSDSCNAYMQLQTWLNNTTTLKKKAVRTTIYTRKTYYAGGSYNSMDCEVFLLSEADVYGTANGGVTSVNSEYTYDGRRLVTDSTMIKGDGITSWLRSPKSQGLGVACILRSGSNTYDLYNNKNNLRPALWVEGL